MQLTKQRFEGGKKDTIRQCKVVLEWSLWADPVYATKYVHMFPCACLCECRMDIHYCLGHTKIVAFKYFQVIKKTAI